jgi:hypothetical protein
MPAFLQADLLRVFRRPQCYKPKWRNWQTRMVQVHVPATAWGFESLLRHQHLVSAIYGAFLRRSPFHREFPAAQAEGNGNSPSVDNGYVGKIALVTVGLVAMSIPSGDGLGMRERRLRQLPKARNTQFGQTSETHAHFSSLSRQRSIKRLLGSNLLVNL